MKPDGAEELPLTPITDSTLDVAARMIRAKMGQPERWIITVSTDDEFYARALVGRLAAGTPVSIELEPSYAPNEWSLKGRLLLQRNPELYRTLQVWSPGH